MSVMRKLRRLDRQLKECWGVIALESTYWHKSDLPNVGNWASTHGQSSSLSSMTTATPRPVDPCRGRLANHQKGIISRRENGVPSVGSSQAASRPCHPSYTESRRTEHQGTDGSITEQCFVQGVRVDRLSHAREDVEAPMWGFKGRAVGPIHGMSWCDL
jgi:hypothetical protein